MSVTQKLMAAGSWSLKLDELTPEGLLSYLDITSKAFSLLVITPARIDPTALAGYTPTTLRAQARYVGVYRTRPSKYALAGAGLPVLLGDEEGKGPIIDTAITRTAGTLTNWMSDLFTGTPNGLSSGTVTNTGTNHSQTYQYVDRRAALNLVCEACAAEYRFNNDLTVDAAAASTLWTWTPQVLISRESDGTDPNIVGLTSVEMSVADDCEDYSSKVYVLARKDGGMSVGSATAGTIPYYGPGGATIRMERVVDGSSVDRTDATNVATQQLARFSSLRRACSVSVNDPDIVAKIRPGDRAYVYDPWTPGLTDTANQLTFRGMDTAPAILRVLGYTWPITKGYGAYIITSEASPQIVDLSDYLVPETGDVKLEVGAIERPLFNTGVATGSLVKASPTGDTPRAIAADAWTSFTPTVAQGVSTSIAKTVTRSAYFRLGRTIIWTFRLDMTGSGTAGSPVTITTPVTMASSADGSLGHGEYFDASVQLYSGGWVTLGAGTTTLALRRDGNTNGVGQAPSFAVANGDVITGTVIFEAATS